MTLYESYDMMKWCIKNNKREMAIYCAKETLRIYFRGIRFKIGRFVKAFEIATNILVTAGLLFIMTYFSTFKPIKIDEIEKPINTSVVTNWQDYVMLKDSSVNMNGLDKAMLIALPSITYAYRRILDSKYKPVVTSANDSDKHKKNSVHYQGKALDFRIKDVPKLIRHFIVEDIKALLGNRYLVLHEDIGTENEHIHVQLKNMDRFLARDIFTQMAVANEILDEKTKEFYSKLLFPSEDEWQ